MKNNLSGNKKNKIIFLLIFFTVLLIAAFVAYSYFFQNLKDENVKNKFFSFLKNNDLEFFINNELSKNKKEKLEKNDYELTSQISFSTTMENNMFSDLDLSKFEFNYTKQKQHSKDVSLNTIQTKYSGNDFLTLDFISNPKQFAIKSDEIVNKYVGITNENLGIVINKIYQDNIDISSFKKLKNFTIDREKLEVEEIFSNLYLEKYANIFLKDTGNATFSKKENLLLESDANSISVTEYTMELNYEEVQNLLEDLSNELQNDDELLSKLVVSNVQNFDNEDTVLEYNNENITQIPAEENNFETSIQIWGENTISDEQTENNNNTVVVDNDTNTTNITTDTTTQENTVTNETTNTISEENVVHVEVENNPELENLENQVTEEQIVDIQSAVNPESQQPVSEEPINEIDNTIIEEDENLRTQGYISINEENENNNFDESSFVVGENFEETMENIIKLSDKINWKTYLLTLAKTNYLQEDLANQFSKMLENLKTQNTSLIIKIYVDTEENKTVKISFEFPEINKTMDAQIVSKSDQEKYLNLTFLKGESKQNQGYRISIYKNKSDTIEKNKISVNQVKANKITQKYSISSEVKGTSNAKKYTNNIEFNYSDNSGEFKANIESTLNFDIEPEITELDDENCLFIDNLTDEELRATWDAIKQKTMQVLSEKNKNLNIIDINNSNSIVKQIEQNQPEVDNNLKEEAKNILIQTIALKMGEYESRGEKLKLQDLENLEIANYEVNLSISSNLAIITVNGYTFKLDSDFNLSDS